MYLTFYPPKKKKKKHVFDINPKTTSKNTLGIQLKKKKLLCDVIHVGFYHIGLYSKLFIYLFIFILVGELLTLYSDPIQKNKKFLKKNYIPN